MVMAAVWMLMLRCLVEKQLWSRTINQSQNLRTAFDGNEDEVIAIDGWIFKLVSWFDRFTDKVGLESCRGQYPETEAHDDRNGSYVFPLTEEEERRGIEMSMS